MPRSPSRKVIALVHDPVFPYPRIERDQAALSAQLRDVDRTLALAAGDHRQLELGLGVPQCGAPGSGRGGR